MATHHIKKWNRSKAAQRSQDSMAVYRCTEIMVQRAPLCAKMLNVDTCSHSYICAYEHTHIYIYIYMYIFICIYIYMYIYISIYFNLSLLGMNQFPMSH